MTSILTNSLGLIAAAFLANTTAQAAVVVPVFAVSSSNYPSFAAADAIDSAATTDWASFGDGVGAFFNLDLGAVYNLTTAFVTDRVTSGGFNGSYSGGTSDFTTSYSLTAYTDASFTTIIGLALVFNKTMPSSPTGVASFLDTQSLSAFSGRYIKYTALASSGGNTGLSDIRFEGSAVPEPASWALLIIGFGIIGIVSRRRRVSITA